MISEAELRCYAARWRVDPMVVDLDYSLGLFVSALYRANEIADQLCFKGGTCLRKCYFADYRFSRGLGLHCYTTSSVLRRGEANLGEQPY